MLTIKKSDPDIQQDVLEEFEWDPQVEPTEVGVGVDDGVVTLSGIVETYPKKLAAERDTQRVKGVRAIANDLSVKRAGAHTDTDIAKAAANALESNALIPADKIDITVKNGKVTLSGGVSWDYQRVAASGCVRDLAGVREVLNLITIKQPKVSAFEIRTGIERALVRAAEIDAGRIQVHSEDGNVRLTGTVHAWSERRAATEAAWKAKGVTNVTNDIEVRPI
jgi:osmotically-inducible protein OsmY